MPMMMQTPHGAARGRVIRRGVVGRASESNEQASVSDATTASPPSKHVYAYGCTVIILTFFFGVEDLTEIKLTTARLCWFGSATYSGC